VTAAFIACIYFLVASAVIATGLLDLRFSLSVSVGAVALVLTGCALAGRSGPVRHTSATVSDTRKDRC
jgi:hypothetical protein